MKLAIVFSLLMASVVVRAQPGAEDQISCRREAKAIVKKILQVQERRKDIDVEATGDWGTKSGGEAGTLVWHDIKGIIVDKNGKKVRDLGQVPSEVTFVQSGSNSACVLVGYSLPGAN